MARLDKVKNLTGLAEWYASNERLRGLANLVIVGEPAGGQSGAARSLLTCHTRCQPLSALPGALPSLPAAQLRGGVLGRPSGRLGSRQGSTGSWSSERHVPW